MSDPFLGGRAEDVFCNSKANIPYLRNMFWGELGVAGSTVQLRYCCRSRCKMYVNTFDGTFHLELLRIPEVGKCNTVRFIHVMVAIGAMKLQGLHLLDESILYQSSRHRYSRRIPWCFTCKYNMGVGFHFMIGRESGVEVDGRTQ